MNDLYIMCDVDEFQHKSIGYPYIHWFHMEVSIDRGFPIAGWMVYFMENPIFRWMI
jgi:hypothetical protein